MSPIDPAVIDLYHREGATHIPGAFTGYWADRLLGAFHRILAEDEAGKPSRVFVRREGGNIHVREAVVWDPDYKAWLHESPAGEIVAQVIGASKVRFFLDAFFCKVTTDPGGATPLHHDIAAFCFKGLQLPSFWVALTDVGPENGPLQTVIGSHLWQDVMFRPPTASKDLPLLPGYAETADIPARIEKEKAQFRTWYAKAGDCLLIHPFTVHCSLPKTADAMRIAFTTRWLGDDVRWDRTPYTRVNHIPNPDAIKPGDPPPVDQFPIIWPRQRQAA
jgi:ectoine hydroxylase-related dioxygenase (phytanoyl-CoA dioxygenase family)